MDPSRLTLLDPGDVALRNPGDHEHPGQVGDDHDLRAHVAHHAEHRLAHFDIEAGDKPVHRGAKDRIFKVTLRAGDVRLGSGRADEHFAKPENCQLKFELKVGKAHKQIREWSDIKEVDLIMVGRKVSFSGSGKLTNFITRSSHCSVLIVPENPPTKIEKLLVPINVDNNENLPILASMELLKESELELTIQSIYEVPTGYHYSGKSFREFSEIMEHNARTKMEVVKKRYNLEEHPIDYLFSLDDDHDLAEKIYETALKENVDLIMMGSKGRTKTASLVL